jgi:hypothetical protein
MQRCVVLGALHACLIPARHNADAQAHSQEPELEGIDHADLLEKSLLQHLQPWLDDIEDNKLGYKQPGRKKKGAPQPETTTLTFKYPSIFTRLSSQSADDELQLHHFLLADMELTVVAPSRWTPKLRSHVFGPRGVPCCTKCGSNTSVSCNGLAKAPRRVSGMSRDSLLWPECFTCTNCPGMSEQVMQSTTVAQTCS